MLELDKIDLSSMSKHEELLRSEMDQILMLAWDFHSSYKVGDIQRCTRIFHIINDIAVTKKDLPTLQDFFEGEKIGRYKDTIDLRYASKYVIAIQDRVKGLNDWRVKPTAFK
jgi:hypothetical protein